jgi:hypothetical protein
LAFSIDYIDATFISMASRGRPMLCVSAMLSADPERLVFIDETWASNNMAPAWPDAQE